MNTRPDLKALAAAHGQSNLRFFVHLKPLRHLAIPGMGFAIAFTDSVDDHALVECVIDDEGRYPRMSDGYKISLKPLVASYESRDYYVSDLESILSRDEGRARVAFLGTDVH